jgi:hypothetical protein
MIRGRARASGKVSWKLLAGLLVAATIVAPVAHFFFKYDDDYEAARSLKKAEAAYRAAGLPLSAQELVPKVRKEDNAAPYLQLAIAQLQALDTSKDGRFRGFDPNHPEENPAIVDRLKPALQTAIYASTKPRLDFQRNWDSGVTILLPEYSYIKNLCRALDFRAEEEARAGDVKGCARDIIAARRIASLLGRDPTMMAVLSQIACDSLLFVSVQKCAASLQGNLRGLRSLQSAVSLPVPGPDLVRGLRGDAFMNLATARNPIYQAGNKLDEATGNRTSGDPRTVLKQAVPLDIQVKASQVRVLEFWAALGNFVRSHRQDPKAVAQKAQELVDDTVAHETTSYMLVSQLAPIIVQGGAAVLDDEARDTTLKALLTALIYRSQTGRFPTSLKQLPGKWMDPHQGIPLHLAVSNGPAPTFKVYSLGPKGIDHGGMTRGQLGESRLDDSEYNITASYPPPVTRKGAASFGD